MACDDNGNLEFAEPGVLQVLHRCDRCVVRTFAADRVVRNCVGAIETDLDVEIVHLGEALGFGCVDERTVRGELHTDAAADRILQQLEEVAPDHRLAAADIDVEDLEVVQLVEYRLGLVGRELARVALP